MHGRPTLALPLLPLLLIAGCGGGGVAAGPPGAGTAREVAGAAPRVLARVTVPSRPAALALTGPRLLVAEDVAGRVSVRAAGSGAPAAPAAPVGPGPLALARAGGAAWVALGDGTVRRLDAATGRPAGSAVRIGDVGGLAGDAHAVWVSDQRGRLLELDPRTGAVRARIAVGGQPTDVALAHGGVWVAVTQPRGDGRGAIVRVDPADGRVTDRIPVARGPVLALVTAGGELWAARSDQATGTPVDLVRIDAGARRVDGAPLRVRGGTGLRLAAAGADLWVLDPGSSVPGSAARPPTLQRVDVSRSALAGPPLRVPAGSSAVAADAAGVWVASGTRRVLVRAAA